MERAELMEVLKSMIAEYMDPAQKEKLGAITEDTDFVKDINMDSIDMIDVVINMEKKYGIEVKNETIANLNTVGKCLDMLQERLAEKEKQ